MLLQTLQEQGFAGTVALSMRGLEDEKLRVSHGVDHIFRPYDDGGNFAANAIGQALIRQKKATP